MFSISSISFVELGNARGFTIINARIAANGIKVPCRTTKPALKLAWVEEQ
jgi:hypothetical protein